MIAALLITGLILALLGMWLFVETIIFLRAGIRAFDRYVDNNLPDPHLPRVSPPADLPSPHSTWRTKGSHRS